MENFQWKFPKINENFIRKKIENSQRKKNENYETKKIKICTQLRATKKLKFWKKNIKISKEQKFKFPKQKI